MWPDPPPPSAPHPELLIATTCVTFRLPLSGRDTDAELTQVPGGRSCDDWEPTSEPADDLGDVFFLQEDESLLPSDTELEEPSQLSVDTDGWRGPAAPPRGPQTSPAGVAGGPVRPAEKLSDSGCRWRAGSVRPAEKLSDSGCSRRTGSVRPAEEKLSDSGCSRWAGSVRPAEKLSDSGCSRRAGSVRPAEKLADSGCSRRAGSVRLGQRSAAEPGDVASFRDADNWGGGRSAPRS